MAECVERALRAFPLRDISGSIPEREKHKNLRGCREPSDYFRFPKDCQKNSGSILLNTEQCQEQYYSISLRPLNMM